MQWLGRMVRSALPVSAAILLLVVSEAKALSTADLIEFPIVAPAELDLSTDAISLSKGTGYEFSLARIGVHNPSGNQPEASIPDTWTLLSYSATVTYLPGAIANEVYEPSDLDLLLVMTSLREGSHQAGDPLPLRLCRPDQRARSRAKDRNVDRYPDHWRLGHTPRALHLKSPPR